MPVVPETINILNRSANLLVKRYARPGADTIILIHGGPGVPDEFTEARDYLINYFQVITFEQRGTGIAKCRGITFTIEDYLEDINAIADKFHLHNYHLLGHSWGGLYAQLYAQKYPDRIKSLFLCSPASGTGDEIWRHTEKEAFEFQHSKATTFEWMMMGVYTILGWLGCRKAYQLLVRQVIINYNKGYPVGPPDKEKLAKIKPVAIMKTRASIINYPQLEHFGRTPYPVIVTFGAYDIYKKSKEYTINRLPFAHVVTIPDCGHTPWKHNFPEFRKILAQFYALNQINTV